jgi:hypothetical protein
VQLAEEAERVAVARPELDADHLAAFFADDFEQPGMGAVAEGQPELARRRLDDFRVGGFGRAGPDEVSATTHLSLSG